MGLAHTFVTTPLVRCPEPVSGRTLWVKDESACPTGTFKDRLGWALARQLSDCSTADLLITCITLGNTLRSVAHYLRQALAEDVRPQILGLFPLGFGERLLGPDTRGRSCKGSEVMRLCEADGALAREVDLESSYLAEPDIKEIARLLVPSFWQHRDITNGIGEAAYVPMLDEALVDLVTSPAAVLVPVGAGVLYDECVNLVESRGLPTVVVGVGVTDSDSVADKIYTYYSPYFEELRSQGRAVHTQHRRHPVLSVADKSIRSALDWAGCHGYNAEPSAVAALVPLFERLVDLPNGDVLWINTGNGIVTKR